MTGQGVPDDRYGSRARRRARPGLRWLLAVLTGTALVAGSVIAYQNLGSQPIKGEQSAFQVLDDETVAVTVEVQRDEPRRPAECVVRALAESGLEVGRKEVLIPSATDSARYDTKLRTSQRAVAGEVYGCTYNVPEYLSNPTRPTG